MAMPTLEEWTARIERDKQTRMTYWLPLLQHAKLLIPATTIIPFPEDYNYGNMFEDEPPEGYDEIVAAVERAVEEHGRPCFIRTDVASAKHEWKDTCFISEESDVRRHLYRLLEHHEMIEVHAQAFVVRNFLPLRHTFTAFVGQIPVSREFRFFVRDGEVEHYQFYWPLESILIPTNPGWREELIRMSVLSKKELALLHRLALRASRVLPGFWSVDFAQDDERAWWLIDTARGEDSYRYEFNHSL